MIKIVLFLIPLLLFGENNLYLQGKKLYFAKGCNGCHGISATGTNEYPSLAYRRKPLLTYKLNEYRAKRGNSQQAELMIPFAMQLNDSQINALTTFLSEYHESKSTYKSDFSTRGDGGS